MKAWISSPQWVNHFPSYTIWVEICWPYPSLVLMVARSSNQLPQADGDPPSGWFRPCRHIRHGTSYLPHGFSIRYPTIPMAVLSRPERSEIRMTQPTIICLPLTEVENALFKSWCYISGSSGAFSGVVPRTSRCS